MRGVGDVAALASASTMICAMMVSFTSNTTKLSIWPPMDPLLVPSGEERTQEHASWTHKI